MGKGDKARKFVEHVDCLLHEKKKEYYIFTAGSNVL